MSDYAERLSAANQGIRFTDVRGKQYAEVNQRILAFWSLFPDGRIVTTKTHDDGQRCDFVCEVYRNAADEKPVATGNAFEMRKGNVNSTSYIENCETSAVGRALGLMGIGATTAIASADEVLNAIRQQEQQPQNDVLRIAYQRLGEAIEGWCERQGLGASPDDIKKIKEGVRQRPEWKANCKSLEYINSVTREFADG